MQFEEKPGWRWVTYTSRVIPSHLMFFLRGSGLVDVRDPWPSSEIGVDWAIRVPTDPAAFHEMLEASYALAKLRAPDAIRQGGAS